MTNHVPLHSLGVFEFQIIIIGEPIFNYKLCDGIPGKSSKFKNLKKKLTTSSGSDNCVDRFKHLIARK